jgi:hypothetical protein
MTGTHGAQIAGRVAPIEAPFSLVPGEMQPTRLRNPFRSAGGAGPLRGNRHRPPPTSRGPADRSFPLAGSRLKVWQQASTPRVPVA